MVHNVRCMMASGVRLSAVGVNARPVVEGVHNVLILLALLACHPLRQLHAKAKTE